MSEREVAASLQESAMKKSLVICNIYPLPEMYGGGIRTMNFVRFFKNLGSVDLLCKSQPSEVRAPAVFRKEWFLPGSYYLPEERRGALNTRLYRMMHPSPWMLDETSLNSRRRFLSILGSEDYDIVLVRYLFNTGFIFDLPIDYRKRVVVDYDDILSSSLFGHYHGIGSSFYSKFRLRLEKEILKKHERKCLRLGAAIFCSEEDRRQIMEPDGKGNAHVVPNIYENESFRGFDFGNGFCNLESILFVGPRGYKPTLVGLNWFLEEIYPAVLKKFPKVRFSIVGRSSLKKEAFDKFPGVLFYPNVPDVKPLYRDCGVVVVPLLSGGGTRIKILEAGLSDRPVLSTALGAYGLGLAEGRDVLLFDNAESFTSHYSTLFRRDVYESLVRHLHDHVASSYSQAHFNEAMRKVVATLPVKRAQKEE